MSTTFRPRTPCTLKRTTKRYDGFGRPVHTARARRTRCAIITMTAALEQSSVRTDSSASRGHAEDLHFDCKLLFHPREDISTGDLVEMQSGPETHTFEIQSIFRRPDVAGAIHHIEVTGLKWASE